MTPEERREYMRRWRAENPGYNRRWREQNPEKVAAYNESRRIPPVEHVCSECGEAFLGRRDRLTCSRACSARRFRRTQGERYHEYERQRNARRRAHAREET